MIEYSRTTTWLDVPNEDSGRHEGEFEALLPKSPLLGDGWTLPYVTCVDVIPLWGTAFHRIYWHWTQNRSVEEK